MGRVRCNYCGSFIDDALPNCPHCGAVNEHMVRFAVSTPKTIEELKTWYTERNLPPEETTRFFIGKDVKAPRAFGIYEKSGRFIVYKNKSDGTRAIRYDGGDEAYAVNEIYMKLKEEILNQKNRNLTKAPAGRAAPPTSYQKYRRKKSGSIFSGIIGRLFIIMMIIGILSSIFEEKPLQTGYYASGDPQQVYYRYSSDEWWQYDPSIEDWSLYTTGMDANDLPEGISEKDHLSDTAFDSRYHGQIPACTASRNYIDLHHPIARQGYYIIDHSLFYFLDNTYGDNSGWYAYDNGGWDYYCDEDDKEAIGEDLWYSSEDYYSSDEGSQLTEDAAYYFSDNEAWNSSFEDTPYYETYQSDLEEHQESIRYTESDRDDSGWSSWDNDSSWDWDSGDSWDSGWSDWDSDW